MNRFPRRKPTSVSRSSRASCTARLDGAETEATTGMPATHAFWMISKPPRPLTIRTFSESGSFPASNAQPTTLSTALWRPTSSRSATISPRVSNSPAACKPPVRPKIACASQALRQATQDLRVEPQVRVGRLDAANPYLLDGSLAANAAARRRKEIPLRLLEVERRLALELDLDHVAAVLLAGALLERADLLVAPDQPFGIEEPRGQLEVMAGGPHGHGERELTDADLQRLLADQVILEAAHAAVLPFGDQRQVHAARALRHVGNLLGGMPRIPAS